MSSSITRRIARVRNSDGEPASLSRLAPCRWWCCEATIACQARCENGSSGWCSSRWRCTAPTEAAFQKARGTRATAPLEPQRDRLGDDQVPGRERHERAGSRASPWPDGVGLGEEVGEADGCVGPCSLAFQSEGNRDQHPGRHRPRRRAWPARSASAAPCRARIRPGADGRSRCGSRTSSALAVGFDQHAQHDAALLAGAARELRDRRAAGCRGSRR